jgi:general nucleoside transport system ATP-binding protein
MLVASDAPLLEMRDISKRFPGVLANDAIDFEVRAGEVHALLGENGAGKSTLMKILYGMQQPDSGEIRIDGVPTLLRTPADAIAQGIGMVHQHFMLVPTLTVAQNVALGLRSSKRFVADIDAVKVRLQALSDDYGLTIDPDAFVWQLAVGERQRVEILKALYRNARLLVLDEPTAVLTPSEVDTFFATLRRLAADGLGIVFISHKLHEVIALSHRCTVLRDGKVSGGVETANATRESLAALMVGRDVTFAPARAHTAVGPERLRLAGLRVRGDRGVDAVHEATLTVHGGEIVGIAGVSGNGQREFAEALAGLRRPSSGTIHIDGRVSRSVSPAAVRSMGVAYVPEERMRDGAIGAFSVSENLLLIDHARAPFARRGFLRRAAVRTHSQRLVDDYAVKTPSLDTATGSLSGGNIQKMIIARELSNTPGVLVVAQPTRGVDIGAAEYIHGRIMQARAGGAAIIVISEDLDELLALVDRVAVMFDGRIIDVLDRADATVERLGLLMGGVKN